MVVDSGGCQHGRQRLQEGTFVQETLDSAGTRAHLPNQLMHCQDTAASLAVLRNNSTLFSKHTFRVVGWRRQWEAEWRSEWHALMGTVRAQTLESSIEAERHALASMPAGEAAATERRIVQAKSPWNQDEEMVVHSRIESKQALHRKTVSSGISHKDLFAQFASWVHVRLRSSVACVVGARAIVYRRKVVAWVYGHPLLQTCSEFSSRDQERETVSKRCVSAARCVELARRCGLGSCLAPRAARVQEAGHDPRGAGILSDVYDATKRLVHSISLGRAPTNRERIERQICAPQDPWGRRLFIASTYSVYL